jgi:hypothetical protein
MGAGAAILSWLLLAAIVNALVGAWSRRSDAGELSARWVLFGSNALALALAAFLGGYMVTRLTDATRPIDAAASGALASTLGFGVTLAQPTGHGATFWISQLAVFALLLALGGAAGMLGGRLGRRGRAKLS